MRYEKPRFGGVFLSPTAASGRKRTLDLTDFGVSERPVSGKADISGRRRGRIGRTMLPQANTRLDCRNSANHAPATKNEKSRSQRDRLFHFRYHEVRIWFCVGSRFTRSRSDAGASRIAARATGARSAEGEILPPLPGNQKPGHVPGFFVPANRSLDVRFTPESGR